MLSVFLMLSGALKYFMLSAIMHNNNQHNNNEHNAIQPNNK
jgi:hypothetical protein